MIQNKPENKTKTLFIIMIFFIMSFYIVKAEENEDGPTFNLPEEVIMGKEKQQEETEGKQDTNIEEKYELEKSSSKKIIPDILLKEREQNAIQTQDKRRSQNDMDVSVGNYYGFNLQFNHKQNLKKLSYSLKIDKEYGNRSRPDSIYDYYSLGGQLFSAKIDFDFKLNYNKFDLPGMIHSRFTDLSRKCNNYKFSFDLKAIENIFIILNGENTNIKENISRKNQTVGIKILYDFNTNKSPYAVTCEAEENKLSGQYHYWFYSFELENQAISLDEKNHIRAGAGISREGGEKLYLNPKINYFYKYNHSIGIESGVTRQDNKIGFYELYGKNNFTEINLMPLNRINYWQLYSKVNKKFNNDNYLEVKIFHDWVDNYIGFDEDEANPDGRSEEHTSELQSHSFISYAVFCLKKKKKIK